MNRSDFIKKSSKFLAIGTLAHFALLGDTKSSPPWWGDGGVCPPTRDDCQPGASGGATDNCPGGEDDDVCNPNGNEPDLCPGEAPPADVCDDGRRAEDICNVEIPQADTCEESKNGVSADQCESGVNANDECLRGTNNHDECPSAIAQDDTCKPNGNDEEDGDICPGGGGDMDNCVPSMEPSGDVCPSGGWYPDEDDCRNPPDTPPDACYVFSDDSCTNGTNLSGGAGQDDWCEVRRGPDASDVCIDGSPAQDLCLSGAIDDGHHDTCPGGDNGVDDCHSGSQDYCFGGKDDNDVCGGTAQNPDECPGGGAERDRCGTVAGDSDECTALQGCAGGDQSTGVDKDVCTVPSGGDKCDSGTPDGE